MNLIRAFLVPALLVAGLAVSGVVIVTALQAGSVQNGPAETPQIAMNVSDQQLASDGRALFVAKGCIVCHAHRELAQLRNSMQSFEFGYPDLTSLRIDRDYLRRWLQDPDAIKPGTDMPNLKLSTSEIDALVAFLANPKQ